MSCYKLAVPLFDLPIEQLREYRPERTEPADFDQFWQRTFHEAAEFPLDAQFTPFDSRLSMVDVFDVSFRGWGGDRIGGWFITPRGDTPRGCVVKYLGYTNGRGFPFDHLLWPAAGWATLVMDTRSQGAVASISPGVTDDPHGAGHPYGFGVMTKGILDPESYFYRRVFTDAARAVDVAASFPGVDRDRIVVAGGSQGGAIAQAVAAVQPAVCAALIDVPFLNQFRRAAELASTGPYPELVKFLASQRGSEDKVFHTLSYFDGVNFAARATVPALYSVALMDTTCPPSTVFAAYNHWGGPKQIEVWPWNAHEGGEGWQIDRQLTYLREQFE
jgi:cephalosporin-C deacetylase